MIAAPLLREEDIIAERAIIRQEIDEWFSSPHGESLCRLPGVLWPGHPLGHDQLGSSQDLDAVGPETLRQAHRCGYDRSRCVLLAAGGLSPRELLEELEKVADRLPDRGAPARHAPASYGSLPSWTERLVRERTGHDDSIIYLLFPVPPRDQQAGGSLRFDLLEQLITAGDLGSPLSRIVRERSQLAYSTEFVSSLHPDGGYWGLAVQTNGRRTQAVVDCFHDVLSSPELLSAPWRAYVRDTIVGQVEMHDLSPAHLVDLASDRLINHGQILSDQQYLQRMLDLLDREVDNIVRSIQFDSALTVTFLGTE
jgi:predicted Zn-dependent peptidase